MELDFNVLIEKRTQNSSVQNFLKELSEAVKKQNNLKGEHMEDVKLTPEEDLEFYREECKFLQDYFKRELLDLSKGEIYIVTNKYENDNEFHRYKVAQYRDNLECKYIAFEKDLPQNVQLRDVVRKVNGKYIYDEEATKYVRDSITKIKEEIIKNRINVNHGS